MPLIDVNGIKICYEEEGPPGGPPVLLLHGLGCQLVQWPESWLSRIAAAGFRVLRMDNRDVGLSEKLDALGSVDIMAFAVASMQGHPPAPPYSLSDMSDDAAAVLDHLDLAAAHVVGLSMGGMIAQQMAIRHPHRVLSLASIMSSSGAPNLPAPDPDAIRTLMAPPVSSVRAEIIAQLEQMWNLIGGPHFRSTELGIGRMTAMSFDRCRHPQGRLRQMAAVIADAGRANALSRIRTPTCVIHGEIDPLVPLGCGEDTARRIPGARIKVMPKMGHDLPEPLIPEMVQMLVTHWDAAAAQ
jgi:pimeloyl-ACP methyl ester carboxylesterase